MHIAKFCCEGSKKKSRSKKVPDSVFRLYLTPCLPFPVLDCCVPGTTCQREQYPCGIHEGYRQIKNEDSEDYR